MVPSMVGTEVLVVDDILGNGATALAMQDLCDQVRADVLQRGLAVLGTSVEKSIVLPKS